MKRKIVSLLLMVVLCLNLTVCVYASQDTFVEDFLGVLSEEEIASLNQMAAEVLDVTDVGVFFIYETEPDLVAYDYTIWTGDLTDYYIMLENEDSWYYFAGGKGAMLDPDALREVYDVTETYVEGVEAYLAEASAQLRFGETEPTEDVPAEETLAVMDDAQLLSSTELTALHTKLQDIGLQYGAQIVVCTLPSMDGGDIDEFLPYLYDFGGFGYGENHDGVLLLVSMDPREYRILSNGFAGKAITDSEIEAIGDAIISDLSSGNYTQAFDTFADKCEYYLDGYLNGYPFDVGVNLLVAVAIGLLVGIIVASVLKGQLKSVRKQDRADVYVKPGSLDITQAGDFFMYRNVTRTERQQNKPSSGGGPSRSTGGGSF